MPSNKCVCCLFVIGCFVLVLGIVGLCLMPLLVDMLAKKQLILKNGTNLYDQFLSPTVPIYFEVYIFHLVNSAEVLNGITPVVEQKGPYTYREYHEKYDLHETDDYTIVYKQNRTFHFVRDRSIGPDTDVYVTGNIPLMTLIYGVENLPESLRKILSFYLKNLPKESLFIERSVREITWGYHDPFLAKAKELLPSRVNTDFVGVLTGNNYTYDGVYEVNTGVLDVAELGQIQAFNGTDLLTFWNSMEANQIVGTDGSIFRPFLTKEMKLRIFLSDICRSVYMEYLDTVSFMTDSSIELWRFKGPLSLFESGRINPHNAGFCTPDVKHCLPSGLLNLTVCKSVDSFALPIVASQPHFLGADPHVIKSIDGIHPDVFNHTTYVHLEPTTGIMMEVYKRLQINLYLTKVPGFSQLENIQTLFFPVLWINENMVMDDKTFQILNRQLFIPRKWGNIALYSLIALAALICLSSIFLLIWKRTRRTDFQLLVNAETPNEE